MPARDGYTRVVIWQPFTGFACDVAGVRATGGPTPEETNEKFRAADGSDRTRSRSRTFEITTIEGEIRDHLKRMRDLGCKVKAVGFGFGKAHQMWQEGSRLQLVDARGGFGRFAGGRFQITNRVFDAAIWQAQNLIDGIPWFFTDAVEDNGTFFLEEDGARTDYQGPKWECSDGDSVDGSGVLSASGAITLEIELPAGGAILRLTNCTAVISALDFSGAVLASATDHENFELPGNTWSIEISLSSAGDQPELDVFRAGKALEPRIGAWTGGCSATQTAIDEGTVDVPWDACFGQYACDDFDSHEDGSELWGKGADCGPVWINPGIGNTVSPRIQGGVVRSQGTGNIISAAIINAGRNQGMELFCRGYLTQAAMDDATQWTIRARQKPLSGSNIGHGYSLTIWNPNESGQMLLRERGPFRTVAEVGITLQAETWFEIRWVINQASMEVYYRENENEDEELIASGSAPKYTESEYSYFGLITQFASNNGDVRWDDFCVRDIGFADEPEPQTGLLIDFEENNIVSTNNEPITYEEN